MAKTGDRMSRIKQGVGGVFLWGLVLLGTLSLVWLDPAVDAKDKEEAFRSFFGIEVQDLTLDVYSAAKSKAADDPFQASKIKVVLGTVVPVVSFAFSAMLLALWAVVGSGSAVCRSLNCLIGATLIAILVVIRNGRYDEIDQLSVCFAWVAIWLGVVWTLAWLQVGCRTAGMKSLARGQSRKAEKWANWSLTVVSLVVLWRVVAAVFPGALLQLVRKEFSEAPHLLLLGLGTLFLYPPLVSWFMIHLRRWISIPWLRVPALVAFVVPALVAIPNVAEMLGADLPGLDLGDFIAIFTFHGFLTFGAVVIALGKPGDWFLARKLRWLMLFVITCVSFWAMIPGLLLRLIGCRFGEPRQQTGGEAAEDDVPQRSWIAGTASFAMLMLVLVSSVYAGLRGTGVLRQHELALIGFNAETGQCSVGVRAGNWSFSNVEAANHPHKFLVDRDLEVLQQCSDLRELVLNDNPYVTGSFLSSLHDQTGLERLQIAGCPRLSFAELQHAKRFRQLKMLNVTSTVELTEEPVAVNDLPATIGENDLSFLRSCKQLTELRIVGYKLSGKEVLKPLATLPEVVWLTLYQVALADEQLEPVGNLENLRGVFLDGTSIGDAGLAHFGGLQHLSAVYLRNTRVSDAGMMHLQSLKNLQVLRLNGTSVGDDGLALLARNYKLRELGLESTDITDRGLVHLEHLQKLYSISLVDTEVTGAGLTHLAGLKQLSSIGFDGTQVSDADLIHLRDLKELDYLERLPYFDDQFTPVGLCRLVMYLPKYEKYFYAGMNDWAGETATIRSPFDNETLTASRAAVYLKENVSPDELSADERQQMATLLLAGEYGVKLEYDSDGRVGGVTFSGIPLSPDLLQLLSWLPQLSSVSMNYSRVEESLVGPSDLSEQDMPLPEDGMPLPEHLASSGLPAFQQSDLASLARISGLENLQLDGEFFTDDVIEHVIQLKGLRSLELSTPRLTGATLAQLKQLPGLQEISFSSCKELTDEGLLAIAAIPGIRSLSFFDCKKITSKGLAGILSLPELERLTLDEAAKNLDEQLLEKLTASHLKSVTLVGELDDSICVRLAAIASLEEVTLSSTVVRGEQLGRLQGLEGLVILKLEGCTSLTTEGLRQLNQLTGLKRLHLNHTEVSDEKLLQLTDLAQLEFLDLRVNESLTDAGLAALAAMPRLQELSLFYCPGIQGAGFVHVAKLSDLKVLNIGNNKIQDEGLERLSENRSIQELKASLNQNITDAGVIHLAKMKQLKKLELRFSNQVTPVLIEKLSVELPACKITRSQR